MNANRESDRKQLAAWLTAAGKGDQQAFARLYEHSSAKLFGVCLRMLHERNQAEEILQDAFVTIWKRASSFEAARASAMTWMITVTRNKAIDSLRKRRDTTPIEYVDLESNEPSPSHQAEHSEQRRRIEDCLDQLEHKHKSAVREAFFSGVTYKQLAARCKVPLGTMKSWIRRSLIQLRTCLEQ